jgi:hypothetical protein
MTTYVIEMLLPRRGLWERFQHLLHPTNLDTTHSRNVKRLQLTSRDNITDYMIWKVTISDVGDIDYIGLDESILKNVCDEIETGTYSLSSPRLNVRLGQHEKYLRDSEQMYVDLVIHPSYLRKPVWCDSEHCLISMYLPTRNTSMRNQDRNFIRPLLGMVFELLNPTFAFSRNENTEHSEFQLTPPRPIWQFYAPTMVFGSDLVQQIGLEHLRKTPSFRLVELDGPMIWISNVGGMGDEDFSTHRAIIHRESENRTQEISATDMSLSKLGNFMARAHYHAVTEHLGLKKWEKTYLSIETEAQQKFLEWMVQFIYQVTPS